MKDSSNSRGSAGLSGREHDVLALAMQGCTDRAIADQLHLSAHTVDTYWRRVFSKLGVHSRIEAIAKILNMHSVTQTCDMTVPPVAARIGTEHE